MQVRKLPSGTWKTLMFDLRQPNADGPLRVDPGSEPSFIEVGDIAIHSAETGDLLWSSQAASRSSDWGVGGTAVAHPGDPSLLINIGDDPHFVLNVPAEARGPIRLTLALRITPAPPDAMRLVEQQLYRALTSAGDKLAEAQQEIVRLQQERDRLTSTQSQLEGAVAHNVAHNQELENELLQLRQVLAEVERSASWRVTSPLRRLMAALRAGKR
jgi:hypothetical protein